MKIVFFFENEWAFGAVHNELAKNLLKYGIHAYVLDWRKRYSQQEMLEMDRHIDFWVTNPNGAVNALKTYGISSQRIVVVMHAHSELEDLAKFEPEHSFLGTAVITKKMLEEQRIKFPQKSDLLPVRITVDAYRRSTPKNKLLKRIGFANSIFPQHDWNKRSTLIQRVLNGHEVQLVRAHEYHNSWITNCSFYSQVDAVVVASRTEAIGMPLLEAGAAGCLVITTPVGSFEELVTARGADTIPIADDELGTSLIELLDFYLQNPQDFLKRREEIEDHSNSYDWKFVLPIWRDVLEKYHSLS